MGSTGTILGGAVLGMRQDAPAAPARYLTLVDKTIDFDAAASAGGALRPPATPELDASGTNALMEAERERERRRADIRRHQGRQVFTSGLGASGLADTAKKTLLGG